MRHGMTWFENVRRYVGMAPEQLAFCQLTGSQRGRHDNQKLRDPAYTEDFDRWLKSDGGKIAFRSPSDRC